MSQLLADVRFALRSMVRTPGASFLLVGTLAVGLAANGVVFNILDALVLRGFDFPNVPRLARVWETSRDFDGIDRNNVAPANLIDWREQGGGAIEELIGIQYWDVNLRGESAPERLKGFRVSPGFFAALGVAPAAGRGFLAEEATPGRDRRVVLGHALWQRGFGGTPIVGRTVTLDAEPYEVVGIAPRGFSFLQGAEVWAPLALPSGEARRDQHYLSVMAVLAEGHGVGEAAAELGVVARRLEQEHPSTNAGRGVEMAGFSVGFGDPVLPRILVFWQGAALLVLLIACVNVANLILARGAERRRELALRVALGAGRGRVVRQLLTEGAVAAVAAAALSMPLAALASRALRDHMPAEIVRFLSGWENLGADWRMLAFSALLALVASALFTTVPALRASRTDVAVSLRDASRSYTAGGGRQGGRNALVVVQLAAALVLVATAGAAVRAAAGLLAGPQGYDPEGLLAFDVSLPDRTYEAPERRLSFVRDATARLAGLPGVTAVTAASVLPARGPNNSRPVEVEGQPPAKDVDPPAVDVRWVEPGYFDVMRLPIVRGRGLEATDDAEAPPVAVVSRSMADRFWPGQDPIGRRFRIFTKERTNPWLTVVGVSGDVIHQWLMRRNAPTFYAALRQQTRPRLVFAVRTSGDPESLAPAMRRALAAVDPDLPADDVASMRRAIARSTIGIQYVAGIMAAFGVVALVLAVSGVYGVLSYRVSLRRVEIGVRMALGATRRDVLSLTLGQALRLSALGLGAGVALALATGRALSSALHGAIEAEAGLLLGVTVALAAAAAVAAWVPSLRALRVDPATALRAE
jgi:putative ABC transport system permease protein